MSIHETIEQLIRNQVKSAIYADYQYHHAQLRNERQLATLGHGDVLFDFAVSWTRDSNNNEREHGEREHGTHTGVIRKYEEGLRAEIFWGHYNLAPTEVYSDYLDKCRAL